MIKMGQVLEVQGADGATVVGRLENGVLVKDDFYGIFRTDKGPIIGKVDLTSEELTQARNRYAGELRNRKVIFRFMYEIYKPVEPDVMREALMQVMTPLHFMQIAHRPHRDLTKIYAAYQTNQFFRKVEGPEIVEAEKA